MNAADGERYSRQIRVAGIGERGQEALGRSHAAIVGCGALGSFHAAALARAGIGFIAILDRDYVEPSNLQRQWLFEESDAAAALPKAVAAERRIAAINSGVRVRGLIERTQAACRLRGRQKCLGRAAAWSFKAYRKVNCLGFAGVEEAQILSDGYLLDSGSTYRLWFGLPSLCIGVENLAQWHGFGRHGLLGKVIEELAAALRASPVEAKREFI